MKRKLFLTIVLILTAFFGFAQIDPQAPLELDKRVLTGKLENGLTYYVMHNDKPKQRAHFSIITNVGSVQEAPDQDGLAHFLEHMCFNGTKHFPGKGIISYMESIGCAFGYNVNAATSMEHTQYELMDIPVVREGIIDTSLLILYDWASGITNAPEEIEAERGVILEEWRTGNNAEWRESIAMNKAIFKGSPLANTTVIGSEENLKNFKHESLINFYETWYRPDLQAVVVVGDIDPEAIVAKINNLFGQLPKAENPKAKEQVVVPDNDKPIVSIHTDAEASATAVTFFAKSQSLPYELKCTGIALLNEVLESLTGSIINERLEDISRSKKAPFLLAEAGLMDMSQTLHSFIAFAASKDGEGVKAFNAIMTELERVKRYGFTPDEFERAKIKLLKGYETEMNNADSRKNGDFMFSLAHHFIFGYPYLNPEYRYNAVNQCLSMINLDVINAAVGELYGDQNLVVFYAAPVKKRLAVPSEQDFLDIMEAVKSAEISAPEAGDTNAPLMDASVLKGSEVVKTEEGIVGTTIWTLANGMQIYVRPSTLKKDEVLINMVANGGRSILADELIPSFEETIMECYISTAGLGSYKKSQLTKMLSGKLVEIVPYVENREHGVVTYSSPKDIETALQLAYLAYTQPRFDEDEFAAGFETIKSVVPNMLKQPDEIFKKELRETIMQNSPRRPCLSEELISKVSLANIEKGYRQLMADQAALKVYIVGNVNLEELKPLVEKYIGSLPVLSEKGTSWVDEGVGYPKGIQKKEFAIPMETPKTSVAIFYNGEMEKNLENDLRMSLLNNILEQLYTKTIREEQGGTYGVYPSGEIYDRPKEEYSMMILFDTDVTKASKLIELVKSGLADIAKNGPDAVALAKAKENLIKDFPEMQIHNGYWYNVVYEYYSLGRDTHTNYLEILEKVATVESIQKLVQQMLSSGNELEFVMNPAE